MKTTEEIVARAFERAYHRENGVCDERDGGPNNCWKSMLVFARAAVRALERTGYLAERKSKMKGAGK